ncbi:MAG: OPT/YSL family transporter [Verrucomicrobiota bacterium]|jgi:uncharacterized oligopeptide transporter (OPT) family protein|nr:OPT/YSL family transporter [Verrucomicrobiota bacterium]
MALPTLSDEQVRTLSRSQKDQWWLEHVFRGDMPQLTVRSALTGFLLGGVLAATSLYIGAKTGISIGVGLTSVLITFALFRLLGKTPMGGGFTILENNCTQSITTAAGYVVTPLTTSFAAYMLVTGRILPAWQMILWTIVISILGVLVAFPLKRRFINEEQLPFPEGRACGVVLDALYTGSAEAGLFKTRLLAITTGLTAFLQLLMSDGWMKLLQFGVFRMDRWAGLREPWHLQERLDTYYYTWAAKASGAIPRILGTDIRQLGLRFTVDAALMGVGGLIGIRVATSCLIGAILNFVVLAPIMIQRGEIRSYTNAAGAVVAISRAEIVNQWALWWGVSMMVVGSLVSLFARPDLFSGLWRMLRQRRTPSSREVDPLREIELPLWLSSVGVPVFGFLGVWMGNAFFGVPWLAGFLSLPLILVLSVICTNSMALTSWTPTGALSKITQFTIGSLDRSNPASNLIPAGMTAEVASNAANLLSDIKPGYMLGAKPRQQAIGHVIGIVAGALAATPLFYLLFLPPNASGVRSTATLVTEQFAMPAAVQWKGVADLIAKGLGSLPASAMVAMAIAAIVALVFEVLRIRSRGRFPLSAVSIGLGVVLPPESTLAMWIGAFVFWWMGRKAVAGTPQHDLWVEGCEPICAGLISGAALIGIGNALVNAFLP